MNQKRFAQWTLITKTVQFRLLPVRLPSCAYTREATPLQRVTPETTTTTYEISSWFQSFTPPKSTTSRSAMLWSNSLNPWKLLFYPCELCWIPFPYKRSSSSRYDQVVQRLSTTMKTIAKGILKDHLVPVASITTCSGNLNGFNNAGYKATFRPLKVQSTSYGVHLVYPYEMHEKTAERCHPNSLEWVVSSCSWGQACSTWHWIIFWDSATKVR
jgi:hypothetical protein